MMWNHAFFIVELVIAYKRADMLLLVLGIMMLILSPLYHLSHERHYQPYEKLTAFGAMIYVLFSSWYYMPPQRFWIMIATYVVNYNLWLYSKAYDNEHYERWHPWLHITIAGTIHSYQYLIQEN
jgi:hypothetical protein